MTGRRSPTGESSAPPSAVRTSDLHFQEQEGKVGGPARQPAGWSLRGGPRTAGEKGRSCTEGPRATDSPVTCGQLWSCSWGLAQEAEVLKADLAIDAQSLPHPGLPGYRDCGPGWVRGVRLEVSLPTRPLTGTARSAPGARGQKPCSCGCGRGQGVDASPNIGGIPIISKTLPVTVSALPTLLPSTSHFPLGNVKVQNAETWANSSLETCSGAAQAFSRPVHPGSQRPDQRKVRAQGLPPSVGRARLARAVSAEAGEAGGRTDVHRSCTAGRSSLHSAMASFAGGAPGRPPGAAPAGSGGPVGQRPALGFTLAARAQQVPRAGRASPRCLAPALQEEGCRRGGQAFSSRLLGRPHFQETS